jgi:hypothetical protein
MIFTLSVTVQGCIYNIYKGTADYALVTSNLHNNDSLVT